jgi:2-(1,2-epoxy-1,2-dihydrophenyl)acetyl-CoA isomerase
MTESANVAPDAAEMLLVNRQGGVVTLTLNRPQVRNAFDGALRKRLHEVLREIQSYDDLRVIILTGAGHSFSTGADLNAEVSSDARTQLLYEYAPVLLALRHTDAVVLAAVNGFAAGIGVAFVAAADLAIMANDASIQLAFSKVALIPDGGLTWELVRILGRKRAYRLMIEGGRLDAAQCLQLGLVNEVVPADQLMVEAVSWAQRLARLSPLCNGLTKRALHQSQQCSLEEAIAYEAGLQQIAVGSEDCREGVDAFFSKRAPHFKGR